MRRTPNGAVCGCRPIASARAASRRASARLLVACSLAVVAVVVVVSSQWVLAAATERAVEAEPAAAVAPRVERSVPEAPAAEADTAPADTGPTFDGRPLRKAGQMTMRTTAYSPDERSCGEWADGWTASGYSVWTNGMRLVAADTSVLPFGTLVSVPGYHDGEPVQVLDRGGAIKKNRLDLLYPTHERALQWGVQDVTVTIWEYAD